MRAFTDQLRDLRGGEFVDEASAQMAELVQAVSTTGKPGKIILELTVKRASKASRAVVVADKITLKAPVESVDNETLMFPTVEGSLLTEDPSQRKLDLKVPSVPATETPKVLTGAQA